MAKKYASSCLGIELTEDFIIFSQASGDSESVIVDKLQMVSIPPRLVGNGDILDVEALADQITKTLSENEFTATNVVVGIREASFLKRCDIFPKVGEEELRAQIEDKVSATHLFQEQEFAVGLQTPQSDESYVKYQPVVFGAKQKSSIETIKELIELIGLDLVAIDLMPLSALRTARFNDYLGQDPVLTIFLDQNLIDFNIVIEHDIEFSQVLHKDPDEILEDELTFEYLMTRLDHFLLSYTNEYPHSVAPKKIVIMSRIDATKKYVDAFKTAYPDYTIDFYSPQHNIHFYSKKYERNTDLLMQSMGAIGLALRFFEGSNDSLSLIKVKKKLGPIINKFELGIAGAFLVLFIAIWTGIGVYYHKEAGKLDAEIEKTKTLITSLKSGEYLIREKKRDDLQSTISYYEQLQGKSFSKIVFFEKLMGMLPGDVVFNALTFNKDRLVHIKATSFLPESVHALFENLQQDFENIDIDNLKITEKSNGLSVNSFGLSFTWPQKDTKTEETTNED